MIRLEGPESYPHHPVIPEDSNSDLIRFPSPFRFSSTAASRDPAWGFSCFKIATALFETKRFLPVSLLQLFYNNVADNKPTLETERG